LLRRGNDNKGDAFMDIQKKIEEVVNKIKSDKDILAKFQTNPIAAVESIVGVDLPDDQIKPLVEGVKAKLAVSDITSKLGDLGNMLK
jgi:hypothetical protein ELI_2599